jgi:hypothetical protein
MAVLTLRRTHKHLLAVEAAVVVLAVPLRHQQVAQVAQGMTLHRFVVRRQARHFTQVAVVVERVAERLVRQAQVAVVQA